MAGVPADVPQVSGGVEFQHAVPHRDPVKRRPLLVAKVRVRDPVTTTTRPDPTRLAGNGSGRVHPRKVVITSRNRKNKKNARRGVRDPEVVPAAVVQSDLGLVVDRLEGQARVAPRLSEVHADPVVLSRAACSYTRYRQYMSTISSNALGFRNF